MYYIVFVGIDIEWLFNGGGEVHFPVCGRVEVMINGRLYKAASFH